MTLQENDKTIEDSQEKLIDINSEIKMLEEEMEKATEEEKPVIQEEITKLQKKAEEIETTELTAPEFTEEELALINEARQETGEANKGKFLNVTEIEVNNKSEEVEIDGQMVTPRPRQTFIIRSKQEDGTWVTKDFATDFVGILLKTRFRLESKFGAEKWFRSNEFSDFRDDRVVVKANKENKNEILFDGSYAEAKEQLLMKNKSGEMVKAFDLIALVYVKVNDEIYKIKTKIGKDAPLFTYTQSFGDGSFLAFETNFDLAWKEVTPTVKFWELRYTRGAKSNLKENLDLLKEINKILDQTEGRARTTSAPSDEFPPMIDDGSQPGYEGEEEIQIGNIPF